ncbi:MAG: Rpn family recombination-promoting nuclease/putative transposase [Bacteroidales bacterium]|nr:Rpn family recombination-promoting nuclease/putative transposase [Bacteroidales bacterium]
MEEKKINEISELDITLEGKILIDKNGNKYRYVDPMTDKGFKILFGSEGNEELLINLLNGIIPGAEIVELTYHNTERHGMSEEDDKAIFDVYCEDKDGVRFLVEMQNWSQHYFNKRAVYYSTYAIQDQAAEEKKHQKKTLGKENWDYNYAPVYVVCFLSFNMKRTPEDLIKIKQDEYLSFYRYIDIETKEELGDGTTLVFIEMNKFQKQFQECHEKKERWLCSMKNMRGQLEIPEGITGTELETLYSKGEIAALPKSKKLNYISYIMSRNDELNSRAEQIADAREEGRAEGREEIIRCMAASGMAAEEIARIVKMEVKDVENVLKK